MESIKGVGADVVYRYPATLKKRKRHGTVLGSLQEGISRTSRTLNYSLQLMRKEGARLRANIIVWFRFFSRMYQLSS